jgi:hypothetical protein
VLEMMVLPSVRFGPRAARPGSGVVPRHDRSARRPNCGGSGRCTRGASRLALGEELSVGVVLIDGGAEGRTAGAWSAVCPFR